jgi:leucyl-tRNA synthetase
MPIKACADKLVNEIAMFGELFTGYHDNDAVEASPDASVALPQPKDDVTKFTNLKKGTAVTSQRHSWLLTAVQARQH